MTFSRLRRELTRVEAEVVCELAAINAEGMSPGEAARASCEVLARLVPSVGLSLSVYRPHTGKHKTVASLGYSSDLLDFLDDNYLSKDPGYHWMLRSGETHFNWLAPDFDYSVSPSALRWFRPAGYSGGSTNHLRDRRNRYVANLHISTEDPRWPSHRSLSLIDMISPALCAGIDLLSGPRRILADEPAGTCGVVLSSTRSASLSDEPACPVLSSEALQARIRCCLLPRLAPGGAQWRWFDEDSGTWHLIKSAPVPDGWLIMHRQEALPFGLTPRELDVLTLVETGATNQWIGRRLRISTKTVGRHIENLMGKLSLSSRVALATTARTHGLARIGGPFPIL